MRSWQGKCLGKISDSRREKEKENQEAKGQSPTRWLPFEKVAPARREGQYGQRKSGPLPPGILGKRQKERREKGKSKFQYPYDVNKGYPSYDSGKGKGGHDKGKSKTFAATAENSDEQSANQQIAPSTEPTYAGRTDQDWDPSWRYSSHETSSTGQAFRDAFEQHEKEAIHEKLIQDDLVQFQNTICPSQQSRAFWQQSYGACHQPSAQSEICDPGQ